MCGIFFLKTARSDWHAHSNLLKHRGPDGSAHIVTPQHGAVLAFHRLAINDRSDAGQQPFVRGTAYCIANAEVYNYHRLLNEEEEEALQGGSDCEVLLPLLVRHRGDLSVVAPKLDAEMAMVVYNDATGVVQAARDQYGVRPLFYGTNNGEVVAMASEAKALLGLCDRVKPFPPGHTYSSDGGGFRRFAPTSPYATSSLYDASELRRLFRDAVHKRCIMSERGVGCFLSGGVDSSLVAATAAEIMRDAGQTLQTFAIGFSADAPDVVAARAVAEHIGTQHHEVVVSLEEGLEALQEVVRVLETTDVTTIRASVPMYLLSNYVRRNTDVTVMLSGEGADELFAGYLYFCNAPSARALGQESERLLEDIYLFDVLRSDRCTAAWGLEVRVPFLDHKFADAVRSIDAPKRAPRDGIEKFLLRNVLARGVLPGDVTWRQKDAFSDAVGYGWVGAVQRHAGGTLDDEKRLYLQLFSRVYAQKTARGLVPYSWLPQWSDGEQDPSACRLKQHEAYRRSA